MIWKVIWKMIWKMIWKVNEKVISDPWQWKSVELLVGFLEEK